MHGEEKPEAVFRDDLPDKHPVRWQDVLAVVMMLAAGLLLLW